MSSSKLNTTNPITSDEKYLSTTSKQKIQKSNSSLIEEVSNEDSNSLNSNEKAFLQTSKKLKKFKEIFSNFLETNKEKLEIIDEIYIGISEKNKNDAFELFNTLLKLMLKSDFSDLLDDAAYSIEYLFNHLKATKEDLQNYLNIESEKNSYKSFSKSSFKSSIHIHEIYNKTEINDKFLEKYDNLVDEYISTVSLKNCYEEKINQLEENLTDYQKIKSRYKNNLNYQNSLQEYNTSLKNQLDEVNNQTQNLVTKNIELKNKVQDLNEIITSKEGENNCLNKQQRLLIQENNMILSKNKEYQEQFKQLAIEFNTEKKNLQLLVDDLEKTNIKNKNEINSIRQAQKNSITNLMNAAHSKKLNYLVDSNKNKLKIFYNNKYICEIPEFNREIPKSYVNIRKSINSNSFKKYSNIKRTITMNKKEIIEKSNSEKSFKRLQSAFMYESDGGEKSNLNGNENEKGVKLVHFFSTDSINGSNNKNSFNNYLKNEEKKTNGNDNNQINSLKKSSMFKNEALLMTLSKTKKQQILKRNLSYIEKYSNLTEKAKNLFLNIYPKNSRNVIEENDIISQFTCNEKLNNSPSNKSNLSNEEKNTNLNDNDHINLDYENKEKEEKNKKYSTNKSETKVNLKQNFFQQSNYAKCCPVNIKTAFISLDLSANSGKIILDTHK